MKLYLKLITDATFGRGDGVAGLIDEEVEHDAATGLPYLRGRALKGLLVEECANLLFALGAQADVFTDTAKELFGESGSGLEADGILHVGAAELPANLREAVKADLAARRLTPTDVLESLTAIRRQTSVAEETGAPETGSLRSMRVLLRETTLIAPLAFVRPPANKDKALALLAACAFSLRRAGTGRNRGRGRLEASLVLDAEDKKSADPFQHFKELLGVKQEAAA